MASTNLPWTLDAAILRRFQRVFNIDLPTDRDREAILSRALRSMTNSGSSLDLAQLVEATRGYSGSDLIRGCSEAKRRLFRKMVVDSRKASRKNHERTPVLRTEDLLEAMKVTKAKGVASEVWWRKKYDHWKGFNEVEQ